jgi:glyoxylase-like metal-dependent hydrolase (beta-lactamase superfamily II)
VLNPSSPDSPQPETPEWCRSLPRPEYKSLERILPNEPWFEIYKVAPNTIAIYEPHQFEETIAYLIMGTKQAVLFDTGMGIGNIHTLVTRLTSRPIVVLNSHTHNDHIGGNWQFPYVFGMDTAFTRANTKGGREDAQAELAPGQICGDLPKGFDPKPTSPNPGTSPSPCDGRVTWGHGEVSPRRATRDPICLLDATTACSSSDTYYPAPIWLYRPETDLDAYIASVKKIAELAPQLKLVLGAHNVPVAQPSVLAGLVNAIQAVRAGQGEVKPAGDGKAIHTVDGFSFLMRATP